MWRKRLCLSVKRRPSDQNQVALTTPHKLNNHPFIYILSRLSSKKSRSENRKNIVAINLCQFLPFTYTWTRKGKTGLKQNNTKETLVTVTSLVANGYSVYMISRPSTIKTCLLVFYPFYKSMWGFRLESRKLFQNLGGIGISTLRRAGWRD